MEKRYRIQFHIKSSQSKVQNNASPSHNHESPVQSTPQLGNSNSHRLPKLTLPIFTGNPLKWQTFWDTYKTAIHNNISLGDIQKFTYLKAQLSGEAASSIEGLPLSESNYAQSIQILEERFGQPHKIVNAHMQALLDLPTPSDSVTHLRKFYDSMENHIRGLEALDKKPDTYGDLLTPIILAKLPTTIKHNLIRENGTTKWDIEQLRRAILKEIQILEAGEETEIFEHTKRPVNTPPSTSSLLTNTFPIKERDFKNPKAGNHAKPRLCVFCSGHHRPHECNVIRDPATRKKIVHQSNLCFNCLNNHRVSKCNSKNRCRGCHQKHHTSLCQEIDNKHPKRQEQNGDTEQSKPEERQPQNQNTPNVNTQVQNTNATLANIEIPDQANKTKPVTGFHTTLSNNNYYGKQTLLKTAINSVESSSSSATAHILFDEGAQRSFITQELADKLDLAPEHSETLNLSVFGGSTTSVKQVDVATIYLRSDNGDKIPVQVIIIPTIAAPQKSLLTTDIRNLPYLSGLKLARPMNSDEQFQISLLIGADHYWDIVENKIIRGPGPTAAKSKIGYLLSGPIANTTPTSSYLNASILKVIVSTEPDNKALERFWNLESIGILPNETQTNDSNFVKGSPGSQDPQMLNTYDEIINEQLQRGFIEKVTTLY
ncbi:uncharacterized protein LOC114530174 [Dendronephthya gigantea]|uniref:uncharacterized protein LOC114530174 n=1 Tax=Dendronephthya gigantea TaxID=151771 RepID=UPI00106AC6E0|nr:uncharacterized protein LOC114530174 [Dendronephthya gigantea]